MVSSHEVHIQSVRPVLRMLTIAAALVLARRLRERRRTAARPGDEATKGDRGPVGVGRRTPGHRADAARRGAGPRRRLHDCGFAHHEAHTDLACAVGSATARALGSRRRLRFRDRRTRPPVRGRRHAGDGRHVHARPAGSSTTFAARWAPEWQPDVNGEAGAVSVSGPASSPSKSPRRWRFSPARR